MSDAMEEQLATQIRVGWKTDPAELMAAYANLVTVSLTNEEVILSFGQKTVSEKEKVGWILPVAKVALPITLLPKLAEIMQDMLLKATKAKDDQSREQEK